MALGIWLYVLPPSMAVPLVLVCSVIAQTSTLPSIWKTLDFRLIWPFLTGGLAGVPLGTLLIAHADPHNFKLTVGVFLLVFPVALYFQRTPMAIRFGGKLADGAIRRRNSRRSGGAVGPAADPVGQRARLGQGRAARHFPDLQLDRARSRAGSSGRFRAGGAASDLVGADRAARNDPRRGSGRARLSCAERQEFSRRGARPVVSLRCRPALEQPLSSPCMAAMPRAQRLYRPGRSRYLSRQMSSSSCSRDSSPPLSPERLGLLLGFVGMAIFGGTLPATRIAVSAIDPIAVTALRAAVAGLCSLALLIVLRRPFPPRRLWFQLVVAMLCVCIMFPLLMALAVQTVDAAHGGVVMGALPIATALVAVLITHERPRPLFWIASLAGGALVIAFALRQGGGKLSSGDLLLFAAVAASAIGYTYSGRLTSEMPGWEVISWVLVFALPISLPAAALTMPADLGHIALKPWLGLLYLALFSQWIGFFAWNAGLGIGGIARVSQVQLLQPFVTFALAAVFNDETITLQILLFAAPVVLTVAISTRPRARTSPSKTASQPQRDHEPPQLAAS